MEREQPAEAPAAVAPQAVAPEAVAAEATGATGRQVIARLADELLPVLIARLESSALGELEVREDGWRVRLRRPLQLNGNIAGDEPLLVGRPGEGPRYAAIAGGGSVSGQGSAEARPAGGRAERKRTQVTSPAVGYFLPRDGLGVGTSLRNGDVIGHVDVLGVRQEVVAPVDGVLARLDAEAGQAVEYGQPIARLEPDPRESRG